MAQIMVGGFIDVSNNKELNGFMFHEVLELKVKNCPRCLRLLCDDAFYLNAAKPDGHEAYCKSCIHEMGKDRKRENKAESSLWEINGVDSGPAAVDKSVSGMP